MLFDSRVAMGFKSIILRNRHITPLLSRPFPAELTPLATTEEYLVRGLRMFLYIYASSTRAIEEGKRPTRHLKLGWLL